MEKYIHYCWFGGKPLSRLAKKCLKSWQKYLPDYKIKRWDETNCDINECSFVKEAYANKKWAFVADYFRTKALNEYGGIYFDTDMKVTKTIDKFLKNETFLGVEYGGAIAVGVWYEKHPHSYLTSKLLQVYQNYEGFSIEKIREYSIPKLITELLIPCGYTKENEEIQNLTNNITIYPRDYFYPLSDDHKNNKFTDNTCMIHYYDASWIPKSEYIRFKVERTFGKKFGGTILDVLVKIKNILRR